MAKGLQIAEPPRRPTELTAEEAVTPAPSGREQNNRGVMFSQIAESEKVQFNKRIKRGVADGYEMLAIRTRTKVPALLEEALGLLEEKYGKV